MTDDEQPVLNDGDNLRGEDPGDPNHAPEAWRMDPRAFIVCRRCHVRSPDLAAANGFPHGWRRAHAEAHAKAGDPDAHFYLVFTKVSPGDEDLALAAVEAAWLAPRQANLAAFGVAA